MSAKPRVKGLGGGFLHRPDVSTIELSSAYAGGVSLTELERRFRMSRGAIKKRLLSLGVEIRSDKANSGPANGRWSEVPSKNAGRLRAHKAFPNPKPCALCDSTEQPTRHHNDEDPSNNNPSNITWLCQSCHSRHHRLLEISRYGTVARWAS
jgi:hypothetical protein